ncbi:hypothetical protein AK51_23395 [Serratia nematodiphila DZ0503SBS1]|nr:hypothetical protein AK51_23395 [Serratia nematodiphila DZ0503SBS1]
MHRFGQQRAEQAMAGVIGRQGLFRQAAEGRQAVFQVPYRLRALGIARRQPGGDFAGKGRIPVDAGAAFVRLGDRQTVGGLLLPAKAQVSRSCCAQA